MRRRSWGPGNLSIPIRFYYRIKELNFLLPGLPGVGGRLRAGAPKNYCNKSWPRKNDTLQYTTLHSLPCNRLAASPCCCATRRRRPLLHLLHEKLQASACLAPFALLEHGSRESGPHPQRGPPGQGVAGASLAVPAFLL
jgi:hypothetical protein